MEACAQSAASPPIRWASPSVPRRGWWAADDPGKPGNCGRRNSGKIKDDALPWDYNLAEADALPAGKHLLLVKDIAFTQKQVNDTFSFQQRDVMELINGVLSGQVHPRHVPLIRVAWHDGQFWAIDNRRLFCYKHCRAERVLVEVIRWEDQHEFEMKWKNGLRARTNEGHIAGMVQRLQDRPLPRSPVMNQEQNEISWFMDRDAQIKHDYQRWQNLQRYRKAAQYEDLLARNLLYQWKYKTVAMGRSMQCTLLKAKVDGTFEACLDNGHGGFLHPGLHASDIEPNEDAPIPEKLIEVDWTLYESFLVPSNMKAKLKKPWCVVCGKLVEHLKSHEKQHPGCYVCSCGKQCNSSEDLRRHSRKKEHLIPCKFRPPEGLEVHRWSSAASGSEEVAEVPEVPVPPAPRPKRRQELELTSEIETFVVAKGESSRVAAGSCCSICGEIVDKMKDHERQMHPNDFACAQCPKRFTCTEDLRRHSRSTGHRIPR